MSEQISPLNLETEIAELSKQIESKRRLLEAEQGVLVEDRELVSAVLKEELFPSQISASTTKTNPNDDSASADYLDSLDEETVESANALLSRIPEFGFRKTVALAAKMGPYNLDIFHDVLTTRLYDELKTRGYLK
ncbi:MAG: hypothetical protein COX02_02550 [Candidatus Vogelbacteria bacterium CG22_combo_CG10-13_8_21_14_all_37_9]|uniref:Uncharacterized protein n=1 Tax=Candidatus Vogelbacteria bacterium CG22_combo_CG10-13_8_21_14_all_37_9 TaxID=1975046 RepID=A0A2H0BLZ8_9BACT|nr:MAG: hypothetical protein BK005_01630 [bacterium CG10_37_50]PIP58008.1 MAG: hypothetical protein COX02_02550 [Candidatus Vogelbacteria bacterium CG22_combo_CG10-13_8_21_14_all_37_9]